jgi:pyruvate dehydrogenase E2 component (dihydrolipoamide acetyltransferase)
MAQEIVLPQWGMEMQDATVVKWLKQEGDPVQEGEPLVELETAKIATELESIASGVVAHILIPEGATVPIRTVLAIVAAPGEQVARPAGTAPASTAARATAPIASSRRAAPVAPQVVPAARRLAQERGIDLAQVQGTGPGGRILVEDVQKALEARTAAAPAPAPPASAEVAVQVTPAARHLARQHGIDLAKVQGTGPRGRVLIEDVQKALEFQSQPAGQPAQAVPIRGKGEDALRQRSRAMRQSIATRMLQSLQTMAQVTLTTEVDVTEAMTLRAGLARQWPESGLSPLHLVIKATARALQEHPRMNAVQKEHEVELVPEIHIGIAVALEEGLLVPTIQRADAKHLAQIASESRDLATKAREGRATYEEVTGGTFTITNLGAYGIDAFTPIINPPQVGILGVGRVVEKPVVYQGEITKRSMMFLSLTFDHRVIDGAPAAAFLHALKGHLEDPWWMVASVP